MAHGDPTAVTTPPDSPARPDSPVSPTARPYVERERELRGSDGSCLSALEELARRAAELPHTYLHDRITDTRRR